jgi:hypothetical protein
MTKNSSRKRKKDISRFYMELLPLEVFPEESILHEFNKRRISNILLEFALPLTKGISEENFFQFKTMIYFAAVAWNFSFFKQGEERKTALDRFLLNNDAFSDDNKSKMYNIVDNLSLRKRQSFWQYDFLFIDFEVIKGVKNSTVISKGIPYSLINAFSAFGSGITVPEHESGGNNIL